MPVNEIRALCKQSQNTEAKHEQKPGREPISCALWVCSPLNGDQAGPHIHAHGEGLVPAGQQVGVADNPVAVPAEADPAGRANGCGRINTFNYLSGHVKLKALGKARQRLPG